MSTLSQLEFDSIQILKKLHDPNKDYLLGFSGGKDSVVLYHLAKLSNLPIQYYHSNTTIDVPGHLNFIRTNYPDVHIINPALSFYDLIVKKGLPTRFRRFCCTHLKEYVGHNSKVIEGVRIDEGVMRKKRLSNLVIPESQDYRIKSKIHVYPILNWSSKDIFEYIKINNLTYPADHYKLFKRLGCVGCPLACMKIRIKEYKLYPKYAQAVILSIRKNINLNNNISKVFDNEYEAFYWWLSNISIIDFKSSLFKHNDYKNYLSEFFNFEFL